MLRRLTTVPSNWPRVVPPGDPSIWRKDRPRGGRPIRLSRGRAGKVGKGSSAWLVEWLNAAQGPHVAKSVKSARDRLRIIVLIERLQALARAAAILERQYDYNEFIRLRSEMDKVWVAVNALTYDRYDILQGFCPTGGWQYIDVVEERRGFLSDDEYRAYLTVRDLVRLRSFNRLTKCDQCQVMWIFRRRKNQHYCSEKCRQNRYESSADRKKQRREYMREYQRKLRKAQKDGKR
jgi:hypothetical protein